MGSMDQIGHKKKINLTFREKRKRSNKRSTCKRRVHPSRSCSQTCGQGGLGHPHPGQQLSPSCYPICFNRRVIGAHLASSNFASKQEHNNLFTCSFWIILPGRRLARGLGICQELISCWMRRGPHLPTRGQSQKDGVR